MKNFVVTLSLISAILASGCSCSRRMDRLQKDCPECFEQHAITVVVHDTIVTPSHRLDTILPLTDLFSDGGLTLREDNITLRIDFDPDSVTADILATVDPDTVYIENMVEVPAQCPSSSKKRTLETILSLAAVVAFFSWCTIYNLRKYKNESL